MEACYARDQFNVTSDEAIGLVLLSLQAFAGLWINAFIVSVIVIGLVRRKCLNSNEKILLFLGFTRFLYLFFMWLHCIAFFMYPWVFSFQPIPPLSNAIIILLNFSNLWASSYLSVFYCIKIANFQHSFFTLLKAKIDCMVPWMLMGSVLLSLILSIVSYKINDGIPCNNPNDTSLEKFWEELDTYFLPMILLNGFGFATTFLAVVFSALLLLFSLWRHKHRMQENSVSNVSVDAHIKAMKSILSFFFLYSTNFTGSVLSLVFITTADNVTWLLLVIFQLVFPVLHSLVLIFSNPKLEKTLLRTVLWLKCKVSRG